MEGRGEGGDVPKFWRIVLSNFSENLEIGLKHKVSLFLELSRILQGKNSILPALVTLHFLSRKPRVLGDCNIVHITPEFDFFPTCLLTCKSLITFSSTGPTTFLVSDK